MKIAHLILCHNDPQHITRLCKRLSEFSDVYVHVDAQSDLSLFTNDLQSLSNIHFLSKRIDIKWGSFLAIQAVMELLRKAMGTDTYDRYVLLQGADYPIMSNSEIVDYFDVHKDVEFIRGCRLSESNLSYFRRKQYGYWFYLHRNIFTRLHNNLWVKAFDLFPLKMRKGYVCSDNRKMELYWGSAQFSITGTAAQYLLDYYDRHPDFNRYFVHAFPCDEMYVQTVLFNSPFLEKTMCGIEAPFPNPDHFLAVHYFEYPTQIRIWKEDDFDFLRSTGKVYCRKVNTETSAKLLDLLDQIP